MRKLEALLEILGEMERFSPTGDKLSEIISETKLEMEELDESSLEWVAAAQQCPSLQGMMRMKKEEDRK